MENEMNIETEMLLEKIGTSIIHGVNCEKVIHKGKGYLHHDDNDLPYDVDGCMYCGRCHFAM